MTSDIGSRISESIVDTHMIKLELHDKANLFQNACFVIGDVSCDWNVSRKSCVDTRTIGLCFHGYAFNRNYIIEERIHG
jgi:hypothetical protein